MDKSLDDSDSAKIIEVLTSRELIKNVITTRKITSAMGLPHSRTPRMKQPNFYISSSHKSPS